MDFSKFMSKTLGKVFHLVLSSLQRLSLLTLKLFSFSFLKSEIRTCNPSSPHRKKRADWLSVISGSQETGRGEAICRTPSIHRV